MCYENIGISCVKPQEMVNIELNLDECIGYSLPVYLHTNIYCSSIFQIHSPKSKQQNNNNNINSNDNDNNYNYNQNYGKMERRMKSKSGLIIASTGFRKYWVANENDRHNNNNQNHGNTGVNHGGGGGGGDVMADDASDHQSENLDVKVRKDCCVFVKFVLFFCILDVFKFFLFFFVLFLFCFCV